ncbi:MAG: glycosyltransferase [Chloroflexi bacterium]|nr:glycosyltransferase [Chloroflexota bacterium]
MALHRCPPGPRHAVVDRVGGREIVVPRILHLIESLGRGGAETVLAATLREMEPTRHTGVVAYLGGPADLRETIEELGYEVIDLGLRRPADPRGVARVRRLLVSRGIALVHAHLYFPGLHAKLAGWRTRVPVVCSLHNLMYEPEIRIANPRFAPWKQVPLRIGDRVTDRLVRPELIAVSEAVRRSAIARLGVDPARVVTIPDGVDTKALTPASPDERAAARRELGLPRDASVVAVVGRLVPLKGHATLLDAVARLRGASPALRLLVAGGGALEPELRALAARLGVGDVVRFLGPRGDVRGIHAASDVLAAPSLSEGFGLAVVEAMAAGLPCVASRTGGLAEIVEDGATGFLVMPRDPADLADALRRLLGDAELRHRFGDRARAVAQARYDVRDSAGRLEDLYAAVLARRGRPC